MSNISNMGKPYQIAVICRSMKHGRTFLKELDEVSRKQIVLKEYGMCFRGERYSSILFLNGADPLNEEERIWLRDFSIRVVERKDD